MTPAKAEPSKDKFETKSAVWAGTLSRGIVNLNISGPKINRLADIGVDFDSINRREKRKEKSLATTKISTTSMGKAMGLGSGIGRAGANGIPPPSNPMLSSGSAMGMGRGISMGSIPSMGMGAYGSSMNQPLGMGGMGMCQTAMIRPPYGAAPDPGVLGVGYNPMMGTGSYNQLHPNGGYR